MLKSFSNPGTPPLKEIERPGSQPWTMEYVARLFIEGGFQGIANTHNAALERAKSFDTRFLPSRRKFDHIAA